MARVGEANAHQRLFNRQTMSKKQIQYVQPLTGGAINSDMREDVVGHTVL